jgi:prefoldin subunit 5
MLSVAALPGCIVGEIRDELKHANAQLSAVQESLGKLDTTNTSLAKTNNELGETNQLIDRVHGGLGRIDKTNESLDTLEQQLKILRGIETSLTRLDNHLGGLRGTINKLDGVIPFLDLGAGDVPPPVETLAALPAQQEAGAAVAVGATPSAESVAETGDPARAAMPEAQASVAAAPTRESIVGSWVSSFPSRQGALVILPDGRYAFAYFDSSPSPVSGLGEAFVERGTWKRVDRQTLAFQVQVEADPAYDRLQSGRKALSAAATPSEKPGAAGEPLAPVQPREWKLTVVSLSPRSLTTEIGNMIYIWSRP